MGVAIVLSIIRGIPTSWAISANDEISLTLPSGFAKLSANKTLTEGSCTANLTASRS